MEEILYLLKVRLKAKALNDNYMAFSLNFFKISENIIDYNFFV